MAQIGSRGQPQHALIKGLNGKGAIPLPGVIVGDRVIDMRNVATTGSEASSFESTISVAGQLQQTSATNLSANEYWAITIG
jgi:hypothetical protein